ncbi:MAG: hypothetical protein V1702_04770 [Candidatus Woesearchaeota archaeon]
MKAKMFVIAVFIMVLIGAIIALAAPNAPTQADIVSSGRRNYTAGVGGVSIGAQAGNVTQLNIQDNRTTTHWQGYYGTVSGEITLDNGKNDTLYNWVFANPKGEIYAANASVVTWANITCVNLTGNGSLADSPSRSKLNNTILESVFNISDADSDGINETFTAEFTGSLVIGSTTLTTTDYCPMAYMFVSNMSQSSTFKEVLLSDNLSSIWTGILESDQPGFDGTNMDFQMIVPENMAEGTSNYFFFVELS